MLKAVKELQRLKEVSDSKYIDALPDGVEGVRLGIGKNNFKNIGFSLTTEKWSTLTSPSAKVFKNNLCKAFAKLNGKQHYRFDVAVDLRAGSETYGKWYGVELTEENKKQFYISEGFAHSFLVLSDMVDFCYKVTDFYHPGDEGWLAGNAPEIGIVWTQVVGEYQGNASAEAYTLEDGTKLNVSDKDQKWFGLKDTFSF